MFYLYPDISPIILGLVRKRALGNWVRTMNYFKLPSRTLNREMLTSLSFSRARENPMDNIMNSANPVFYSTCNFSTSSSFPTGKGSNDTSIREERLYLDQIELPGTINSYFKRGVSKDSSGTSGCRKMVYESCVNKAAELSSCIFKMIKNMGKWLLFCLLFLV